MSRLWRTNGGRTDGKWKIEQCSVGPETAIPNPTGEILLLLGKGSELKLGKTPLFQISAECRKFSPDWTIQIELRNILWGSHSQISFFTLRNFLISSLSRRVLYSNFTFIVESIFVSCLIVWDFFVLPQFLSEKPNLSPESLEASFPCSYLPADGK